MNNTLNPASAEAIQPKKKTTYYHLVLDRSGSMDSCWQEARQVIDKQLLDLKRIQEENSNSALIFSYCGFNQVLRFGESLMPVDQASINWDLIYPDGMTSLNDAIGESIHYLAVIIRRNAPGVPNQNSVIYGDEFVIDVFV
jgi:hypothetical protein